MIPQFKADNSTVTLCGRNYQSKPYARVRITRTCLRKASTSNNRPKVVYREGDVGTVFYKVLGSGISNLMFTFLSDNAELNRQGNGKRQPISRADFEILAFLGDFHR